VAAVRHDDDVTGVRAVAAHAPPPVAHAVAPVATTHAPAVDDDAPVAAVAGVAGAAALGSVVHHAAPLDGDLAAGDPTAIDGLDSNAGDGAVDGFLHDTAEAIAEMLDDIADAITDALD
jgi:hypothetical protein